MLVRDQERIANLNYIWNCNDTEALWMLQMKRVPFARLVQTFRSRGLLEDSIQSIVEEQVVMFLHVVGHNQRFRVAHNTFRRLMETISRYFKQVMYTVGELRGEMIRSPTGRTPTKIRTSPKWYPYFKDCIGVIDGTHVTARVPRSQAASYRGRKHYTSQNVLVVVDFDLKFTHVLAGWEGSAHDVNILGDSMSHHDGINILDGKFYLGDAGYACRPGVLPPFRKTRYHLNEFVGRNYPRTPQELFSVRHSSLRVTVERAFGALKNRFKILDQKPFHPYPTQMKLVLACCIFTTGSCNGELMNFVQEEEDVTPDEVISSGHGVEAFDNKV
nr:protein ALP1-like [Aegilops tauschii subsp. strangulata]